MDSKVTSKTSSLKALLLKAWSERWSDLQWGIHIKTILPRGVSGDVYNLADIIFQQALVGPGPNQLILSYLKHCLNSQLVSYAAVVQRISKFDGFHKPYCVIYLLKFLENIEEGITCRTKQEEGLLPGSILSLANWFLDCTLYYLDHPCQFPDLKKKPVLLLNRILLNPFTAALFHLAKHENKGDYNRILNKCKTLESYLEENRGENDLNVEHAELLENLRKLDSAISTKVVKKVNFLDYSVQALLKVTVLLNPTVDSQTIVNNLLIIQQLKGYNNSRLYMELIKACFVNLNDAVQEKCTAYWAAFTFIKLPQIIQQLAKHYASNENYEPARTSEEIIEGLTLLMEFCPLLNNIDAQTQNNNVESLLAEMVKLSIISADEQGKILEIRESMSVAVHKVAMLVSDGSTPSVKSLISISMPVLTRIMKTLDSDVTPEHVIQLLNQLASGSSNEIIPTFAAVKGDLPHFVSRLIKYNDISRHTEENDKIQPYTKALIFDLTFTILCSIVQNYGSHVVLKNKKSNSFFEIWVRDCMKECRSNKAMITLTKGYDSAKVEKLLEYFKNGEFNIINPIMPWNEMCLYMPAVMKEILDRWKNTGNSDLSNNDVRRMFETILSQLCCLTICSVSWLSSYMQILPEDQLLKAKNMVQLFITLMEQKVRTSTENKDHYKDRCIISLYILRQMQNEGNPTMTSTDVVPPSRSIVPKDAVYKQLVPIWEIVLQKGCLTSEAAHLFKTVISVSDSRLFMKFMLHEVMKLRFEDELNRAVDLLFALFYFDLHDFTVALLNYLPYLLFKPEKIELVEPQSTAIARLTAYAVCAAVQEEFNTPKETAADDEPQDLEELMPPVSKIMKMNDAGNTPLAFVSTDHSTASQQSRITDKALLKSLTTLFRAFDNVASHTRVVTSDTYFVFNVIEQIVDCGKDTAKPILSNLSNNLIPNLMRSVPQLFTTELILQLYSLETPAGIRNTIRDLCLLRNLNITYLECI